MPITTSPVPWSYVLVPRDDAGLPPGAVIKDFNGRVIASFECARDAEKVVEAFNHDHEGVVQDLKDTLAGAEAEIKTLEARNANLLNAMDKAKLALTLY